MGCTKVAPGCTKCYAEAFNKRTGKAKWGPEGTRIVTSYSYWRKPLKWDREAEAAGERRRVFCASLADVFEDWGGAMVNSKGETLTGSEYLPHDVDSIPVWHQCLDKQGRIYMEDVRRELFHLIDATPHLDWLLLTKRPENVRDMLRDDCNVTRLPPNCWLGASVSEQETADKTMSILSKLHDVCETRFLSAEPLLGPIDFAFGGYKHPPAWVIVGVESAGKHVGRLGAFSCDLEFNDAVRMIAGRCLRRGVKLFIKQLPGEKLVLHEIDQFPSDLRIREFPR